MIKTLNKLFTEEMYFNIMKRIYDKPRANIVPSSKKLKVFVLIRNRTKTLKISPKKKKTCWKK